MNLKLSNPLSFYSISLTLFAVVFLFLSPHFVYGDTNLEGQLMDGEKEVTIGFANVSVLSHSDSSLITGTTSDMEGKFSLSIDSGNYLLRVSFLGYQTLWREVEVVAGNNDLGILYMVESGETLAEVSIEAAALMFRSDIDKRVYDVANTISAAGGSAIQLLETLPSIQVDDEGQINLRGSSNVLIYINGQPTNLTADDTESVLEQFPADAIKSVEVITNPSARYDAEGVGGIINIILNESQLREFNGQLTAGVGTGHKYNGGLNLNYRTNGFNFSLGYNYQYRERWEYSESYRESFTGRISPVLDQQYNTTNWDQSHLIRPGIEYRFNEHSSLNISSSINHRSRDRERIYDIRSQTLEGQQDSAYIRLLEEDQSRINLDLGTSFQTTFGREDFQFNIQARYSHADQDRIEYFDQEFRDQSDQPVMDKRELQTYERPLTNDIYLFQLDFSRPVGDFTLETGWKSTLSREFREQIFNEWDFGDQKWETNDLITDQFSFDEDVHAAYFILSGNSGPWRFQGGLRAEQTLTESYQPRIDSVHNNNYLDFFSSFFLTYEPAPNSVIQASYSRRISRPRMGNLMPFLNAQDLLNLRLGNPYLQPQYTDNYEISFDKMWENFFLTSSIFHRNAKNTFTRVYQLFQDRSSVVTWQNADTRRSTGLEVVKQAFLGRNTDVSLTSSFFHTEIIGEDNGEPYSNSRYSYTFNLMGNTRIPNWFSLQVMANYRGPIVIPQGSIDPIFSMNIGIRREIFNRNGTISLSLSDVLQTRNFTLNTESSNFNQRRYFERESRILNLSLTYRFRGYQDRSERRPQETDEVDDSLF